MARLGPRAANVTLVVVSVMISYLLLEWLAMGIVLPYLPLRIHQHLGAVELLAQSSKRGTVPENYIALVGDSYAKGNGDWLLETDPDSNGPFHSAHVLHERTGRDVVTFGQPGVGGLRGLVELPLAQLHAIDASPWYALAPPDLVLAYVYEGNDFDDNIWILQAYGLTDADGTVTATESDVTALVRRRVQRVTDETWPAVTPVLHFAWSAVRYAVKRLAVQMGLKAELPVTDPSLANFGDTPALSGGNVPDTVALVGGKEMILPKYLQAPSLELSDAEIDAAVLLLSASLTALQQALPQTQIGVVYIPSPLASYQLASTQVSAQSYRQRADVFPASAVARRSNRLCRRVEAVSRRLDIGFIDIRPAVRAGTRDQVIHGPIDWKHFNRTGQTILANTIYDSLANDRLEAGTCGQI